MPFHLPVTECILSHGGSHELVRVINRIGACASLDTANRLSTMVVHDRIYRGILLLELNFNTLSVITIDNVDILQTHAMVSTLDATQSWHGTSIQCVQHMPESLQDVPTVIHNTIKHPQTFKFKPDWISRL